MRILTIRGENLASLYGPFELKLDTGPIAEAGLFSISGPTGAGKSTLIDALCLALFGETPRFDERGGGVKPGRAGDDPGDLPDANDKRNLLSRGAGAGFAEVDFEAVDGARYRARWSVRRARGRADGRFQNAEHQVRRLDTDAPLDGTAKELKAKLTRLVGYTFEEFRRAVVLPQFEFRAFLDARPDERAAILERVTGTAIYSKLSQAAHERGKLEKARLLALEEQAGQAAPLPPEARAEAETRLARLEAVRVAAEAARGAAEAEVRWLGEEAGLEGDVASGQAAHERARAAVEAAGARRAALAGLDRAEPLRAARDEGVRTASEALQAGQELARADERVAAAAAEAKAALVGHGESERALVAVVEETARLKPEVASARELDARLDEAARRTKDAEARLDRAAAERRRLEAALAEEERQVGLLEARRQEAEGWLGARTAEQPLAADWPRWHDRLLEHDLALTTLRAAERALEGTRRAAEAAEAAVRQAAGLVLRDQAALAEVEARVGPALALADADDLTALAGALAGAAARRDRLAGLRSLAVEAARAAEAGGRAEGEAAEAGATLTALLAEAAAAEAAGQVAAARLSAAREALTRLDAALGLEERRSALLDGEPCPLCGSEEHPWADGHGPAHGARQAQAAAVAAEEAALRSLQQAGVARAARRSREELRAQHASTEAARQAGLLAEARRRYAEALDAVAAAGAAAALPVEAAGAEALVAAALTACEADRTAAERAQAAALARRQEADGLRAERDRAQQALEAARRRGAEAALDEARARGEAQRAGASQEGAAGALSRLEAELEPALGFRPGWRDEAERQPARLLEACRGIAEGHQARQAALEAARQALAALGQSREGARASAAAAAQEAEAASGRAELERSAQAALQAERGRLLGGRSVAALEATRVEVERTVRQALATAAARRSTTEAALAAADATQQAAARRQAEAERSRATASAALQAALAAAGLDLPTLEVRLGVPAEEVARERQALAALDQAVRDEATRLLERQERLARHTAAGRPGRPLDAARGHAEAARAEAEQATQAQAEARAALQQDDARRAAHQRLAEALAVQQAVTERWGALSELIGSADGQKLRVFAQGLTLGALLTAANGHLARLAPRYRLERVPRSDLDLQVVDGDLGDEVRGVNGLSGGESFLVSLALALGLSALSTSRTTSRTLFIDEGFGTLDRDTLEHAMAAIDLLRSGQRTVGIISHVPELHERIGVKVVVERISAGRSRLLTPS